MPRLIHLNGPSGIASADAHQRLAGRFRRHRPDRASDPTGDDGHPPGTVTTEHGARFVEVVLMDDRQRALDRFDRRNGDDPWHDRVRDIVTAAGGREFLAAMYDELTEALRSRPNAIVLPSEEDDIAGSYATLRAVL